MQYSKSEEWYRCLFEQANDLIVIHDMDGAIVNANDSLSSRLGYTREEMLGMNWAQLIEPEQLKTTPLRMKELRDGKRIFSERRCICKDGTIVEIEANVRKMSDDLVLGVCRDVTRQRAVEQELHEAEIKFRTILDNTDTVYVLLHKDLTILSYNQRALDFAASELGQGIVTSDNFLDYFPESRRTSITKWMNKVIAGDPVDYEISYPKPGASFTWYNVKMFPVFNKDKKVLGIVTAVLDITQKKLLELEILNQKVQEQKRITRAVIKAQEKERTKIGQELHDNVNQILASARIYLTASCEDDRDNKDILMQESIALIDSAIHELRLLARNEITPQGKLDLRQLIQPLVDNLNEHAVIQTKFDYCMTASSVDTDLKLNIYRIVQEQITNILKHSHAASVHIRLNGDDRYICLSVTDDGKGFETASSRKGIGITNIMNRIESFNGEFSIQSSPGNGCKLSVKFPR
jgi:PAS domain S-box-containing protein